MKNKSVFWVVILLLLSLNVIPLTIGNTVIMSDCISINDSSYLINYNSYLKLYINTSSLNKPLLINQSAIAPITVEYWTNIPDFFTKIPFWLRNYFLFGTFIGPLQEINFDIQNIPDWANIYVNTSLILTTIPYEGDIKEVTTDLIITIIDEAPKESYRIDIIAECDDIKRLNGCDIKWSLEFTPG